MRSLFVCVILLLGSPILGQQPKAITNSIGMKLMLVHADSFDMGSPDDEIGRLEIQETIHGVTISRSYYLGAYEVTQEEYKKVVGDNPSYFSTMTMGGRDSSKYPVENLSWNDAVSFCEKLSELPDEKAAGRKYRLPTESEWEYACRASSSSAYCCGDSRDELAEFAWFEVEADDPKLKDLTQPVGLKKPNRWGLYDMHGNVWEWCHDWFALYPSEAVTDPKGPPKGSVRVYRGGSWENRADGCRSARREGETENRSNFHVGFRIALSPSDK